MLIPDIVCVREVINNMTKTTKAELVELVEAQNKLILALEKKDKKTAKKVVTEKVEIALSATAWQTISGQYGKSISLAPFKEGGKYDTPALFMKGTFAMTMTGLDEARALIDICQNKLEKSGLLTQ